MFLLGCQRKELDELVLPGLPGVNEIAPATREDDSVHDLALTNQR